MTPKPKLERLVRLPCSLKQRHYENSEPQSKLEKGTKTNDTSLKADISDTPLDTFTVTPRVIFISSYSIDSLDEKPRQKFF